MGGKAHLGPAFVLACDGGNEARFDAGEVPVRAELLEALDGEVGVLRVCVGIGYGQGPVQGNSELYVPRS